MMEVEHSSGISEAHRQAVLNLPWQYVHVTAIWPSCPVVVQASVLLAWEPVVFSSQESLFPHSLGKPSQAQRMYEKALRISEEILGERHPQGRTDEACVHAQRASDLARQVAHPELHVLLSNLAAVLTHRELYAQAEETYREALRQAELKRDEASVQHIREELAELARKSRPLS
ncbi:hypothetical protein Celaphus_00001069 [Cervus elaphus hippelaphus]|uniref:TTC19 n=1 Tax=Cervus elaphus hippelaphus TaxID=46360 RepID=A0A212DAS4_CEREH|nr:hypothetical protein Celaphus_00001069 [Cervus elaphus hippelaphus]